MAQRPKGRLVKGSPYKPVCRDCAIYFSITVKSCFDNWSRMNILMFKCVYDKSLNLQTELAQYINIYIYIYMYTCIYICTINTIPHTIYNILLVDEILHHFTCVQRLTLVLPLEHWGCAWLLANKKLNDQNPAPPQWQKTPNIELCTGDALICPSYPSKCWCRISSINRTT